ncbi:MAG TPA: VOC family protein [Vicinamibacterales bacterium]|nr:VOC family protein [Vicinamibacterales bacterium]
MAKKSKNKSKTRVSKSKSRPKSKPKSKPKAARKSAPVRRPARASGHSPLSVTPGFTANDAAATIKWYCDVLGFGRKDHWEIEGVYRGGSVTLGDVTINIGQDDWKLGRDRVKGQGVRMYITTGPDIDGYAAAIKARGGTLDQEPQDEWGMRAFSISDPDGYKLTFMRSLA